jgi:hypothetical protein
MAKFFRERVSPDNVYSFRIEYFGELFLHVFLGVPTVSIGDMFQVAIGYKKNRIFNFFWHSSLRTPT